jgi:cystathionine gamma-synthase/cystathionine gamma-lyase
MQPIVLASTFAQPEPAKPLRFDYSRSGNPTRAALEECLAALESGKAGFAFASGCAAATTLLHTLRPGDHVICGDDVYGGTFRIFDKVMGPLGMDVSYVDLRSLDRLATALTPRTRLVWLETPTNPLLHLVDVRGAAEVCKGRGIVLAVDNTFASPVLQRPLELGATVVVHSTTKYINGHSDVVGGALITSDLELAARLKFLQNAIGASTSWRLRRSPDGWSEPKAFGAYTIPGCPATRSTTCVGCRWRAGVGLLRSNSMAASMRPNGFSWACGFSRWPRAWAAWSPWPSTRRS